MHITIINNGTKNNQNSTNNLIHYFQLRGHTYNVHEPSPQRIDLSQTDALFLSGSEYNVDHAHFVGYNAEHARQAAHRGIPTFGICFGLQAIIEAFERKGLVKPLDSYRNQSISVDLSESDEVFGPNFEAPHLYKDHGWGITDDTELESLRVIGKSEHGIEFVRHATAPIWGIQGHPEKDGIQYPDGYALLDRFMNVAYQWRAP